MVYRRGKVYWYKIKFTRTEADGDRQEYTIRRSAHTTQRRKAERREQEHRDALWDGKVHPLAPWPPPAPPEAPTLKDFSERFLKHVRLHAKASTAVFYETCLKRTLPFHPLSEISMSGDGRANLEVGSLPAEPSRWQFCCGLECRNADLAGAASGWPKSGADSEGPGDSRAARQGEPRARHHVRGRAQVPGARRRRPCAI